MTKEERRRSKDDAWVDILVASHSRRAGNQDAELRRPGGPRPRNASRPDPEAARAEVAQVLAAIRAPSSQFDGDSVDIEPMNVPHRSKIDGSGSHFDEIYAPTIPSILDSAEPEEVQEGELQLAQRRMGYFDIHPERRRMHLTGDEDILDQFAQAASDMEPLPRRSDTTTDSVYSSGPTPPASPTRALTKPTMERLQVDAAAATVSLPSQLPGSIASPQTPSPRELQRQQEVRDRLSGKPGPKASSLIEMYREKERQAATRSSPGKSSSSSSTSTSQEQQPQSSGLVAKESTPLPPPPATSEPSLSPPDTPRMGVEGELGPAGADGDELIEPANIDVDHGRDSPYRYIHGAPLHNVTEEEEED